jgi:DNA-directed RNA polymerase subunit M/transcription elongation factor TFIIS
MSVTQTQRKLVRKNLARRYTQKTAHEIEKKIFDLSANVAECMGVEQSDHYLDIAMEKIALADEGATAAIVKKELSDVVCGWESCIFEKSRQKQQESFSRQLFKPTAIKGLYVCKDRECGSDEFFIWQLQTRSGDEGTTEYRQCAKCGKRGKN